MWTKRVLYFMSTGKPLSDTWRMTQAPVRVLIYTWREDVPCDVTNSQFATSHFCKVQAVKQLKHLRCLYKVFSFIFFKQTQLESESSPPAQLLCCSPLRCPHRSYPCQSPPLASHACPRVPCSPSCGNTSPRTSQYLKQTTTTTPRTKTG